MSSLGSSISPWWRSPETFPIKLYKFGQFQKHVELLHDCSVWWSRITGYNSGKRMKIIELVKVTSCTCWQYRCTQYYLNICALSGLPAVSVQLYLSAMLLYWLADQSEASPKMSLFWLVDRLNVLSVSDRAKTRASLVQLVNNKEPPTLS